MECNKADITTGYLPNSALEARLEAYLIKGRRDKTNKMSVRPAKTQISLGIRPVWSESSLSAQWVAKDPSFLHADSEDSDQTRRMPRLIWVFAGRTLILLVLSCHGSFVNSMDEFTKPWMIFFLYARSLHNVFLMKKLEALVLLEDRIGKKSLSLGGTGTHP